VSGTQTLGRAIDILFVLAESGKTLTVSEIAEKVSIPESTAYRFIQTLIKNGFVDRKGKGQIGLGLRIFDLARSLSLQMERELLTIARPVMEELTRRTKETTLLFVRSGSKAVCIEQIISDRLIRFSIENGRVLPLHSGASGKALLAFENNRIINEMLKVQEARSNQSLLTEQMQEIRSLGYCITIGEVDSDVFAIAAPIFDTQHRVVASLSIAGPIHRLEQELISQTIQIVRDAAVQISQKLGAVM
jgi:DNA-binding IclR family transcriptional regulator